MTESKVLDMDQDLEEEFEEDAVSTADDADQGGPIGVEDEEGGTDLAGVLREFPTLEDAIKDSFFYRIESAISEIFHIIKFIDEHTSDTKTRSDMKRILNGALNNLLLIQEIITRSIREENLLLNAEVDAAEDALEDALEDDIEAETNADVSVETEENTGTENLVENETVTETAVENQMTADDDDDESSV